MGYVKEHKMLVMGAIQEEIQERLWGPKVYAFNFDQCCRIFIIIRNWQSFCVYQKVPLKHQLCGRQSSESLNYACIHLLSYIKPSENKNIKIMSCWSPMTWKCLCAQFWCNMSSVCTEPLCKKHHLNNVHFRKLPLKLSALSSLLLE